MKKILSTLALSAAMSTIASADMVRLEMGVGGWNQEPSGTITYTDHNAEGRYDTDGVGETEIYAWMLIKHPIPIIPNLRLEYVDVNDNGYVNGTFENFSTNGKYEKASLQLTQYDIIPYYNILDNTFWTTIDLGIDIKVVDSTFKAEGVHINNIGSIGNYTDSSTVAIPMVYGRARVEIPGTDLGLESDVKYITYDGSTVYDVRAKIDYTFDLDVIQPGIEVGYRVQKFDIKDDDDNTKMNMDFSGVYAGLMLRF
jgi:outer membrane protein